MKKLLALLLMLCMLFALTSCGSDNERAEDVATEKVEVTHNDTDRKEEKPEKDESDKKEEGTALGSEETAESEEADSNDNSNTPSGENPSQEPQQPQQPQQQPQQPQEDTNKSIAYTLADAFNANSGSDCITIANTLVTNPVIEFMGGAVEVEEGYLTGFDNTEIKGFKSGAMFAPMIGTIPFVGYVFELESASDAPAFINTLKSSANLRWNICTAADEMVAISSGNKVFFVMSPLAFEEE